MEVQRFGTGADPLPTKEGWVLTRVAAALRVLLAAGMPPQRALASALDLVTHWARETGWGRAEWNFNPGNIKSYSDAEPRYFLIDSGGSHDYYVSYPTLHDGVLWTIQKASHGRYADAWRAVGQGTTWYAALMRAGWHPYSDHALVEFADIRRRVVGMLGAQAPAPRTSSWITVPLVAAAALAVGAGIGDLVLRRQPKRKAA